MNGKRSKKEHPGLWCECGLGEVTSKIQETFASLPTAHRSHKKVSETYDALFVLWVIFRTVIGIDKTGTVR